MQSWLEGRIWVGKGAQATEMTASLRILSSKADSNTCESFTRSELKLRVKSHHTRTSSGKGLPSHLWTRDNVRSVLPGLWRKITQWSKVLFSDESKFCISFGNQGPRVWRKSGEAQNPCCLKSRVKFPQSVMIWAAMSSAGVGPLCFLKSTVNAAIYQEILEHFMLPSADKLYGDADFIFQQKLVQWPWCYCAWLASKLAWPEPYRESMAYCQEEDERHQTQQCRWAEGLYQRNLGFHTTSEVPQTDHLHVTPNWGSN